MIRALFPARIIGHGIGRFMWVLFAKPDHNIEQSQRRSRLISERAGLSGTTSGLIDERGPHYVFTFGAEVEITPRRLEHVKQAFKDHGIKRGLIRRADGTVLAVIRGQRRDRMSSW